MARNVKIVESTGGSVTNTQQFLWTGIQRIEVRNAAGDVTSRFYRCGESINGSSYFYTRDHIHSVREMTSSNGSIQAQYDFEPFGTAAKIQESTAADFQYASYFQHARTSNSLPVYRTYSPSLGRWLSRDPLMESGGINLYAYVDNNPVSVRDPLGLVGSPRRPSKKPCCKNPPLPPLPGPNGGPPEDCYKFCTSNTHSCYYWCLRNCEDPQDYLDCIRACNKWLEECLKRCREQ